MPTYAAGSSRVPRPLPYLVYYGHGCEQPLTEIYVIRLYASGQDREDFDMSDWPC